jgi:hypothetical protein
MTKHALAAISAFLLMVPLTGSVVFAQTRRAQPVDENGTPIFKVDPFWPKPLPNRWSMQQVPDLAVDKDDHIWVLNRSNQIRPDENGASTTPPRTDCCIPGPAVLEFDKDGNLLKGWGAPGYVPGWPGLQTITTDREGNVWLSGMGRGDSILKFTADGKFLWEFGHRGPAAAPSEGPIKQNNQQTEIFPSGVAAFDLDEDAHEIYIADGFVNKRILVYDMDTGAFKRGWGGHGISLSEIDNEPVPPYDTSGAPPDMKGFATPIHCVHLSRDGLVYVCERGSDRVQVFTKRGEFVQEFFVHPSTPARGKECGGPGSLMFGPCGTVFNLTFSQEPEPKYLFVADGANDKIWIVDRKSGSTKGLIGDNGRLAGKFHWIDGIASDSQGNLYTGEVETGKRVQKFVPVHAGPR